MKVLIKVGSCREAFYTNASNHNNTEANVWDQINKGVAQISGSVFSICNMTRFTELKTVESDNTVHTAHVAAVETQGQLTEQTCHDIQFEEVSPTEHRYEMLVKCIIHIYCTYLL